MDDALRTQMIERKATESSRRALIGVIGPAAANDSERRNAEFLGRLVAERGRVLLSGGRDAGVMASGDAGARAANGLTLGILPDETGDASPDVDIVVRTGLGSARNNVIALSADVLVACGAGAGTTAEIALGIKARKPIVLLGVRDLVFEYFAELAGDLVSRASAPEEAVSRIEQILTASSDEP